MDLYTYDRANTVTKKTTVSKVVTIKIAILKARSRIKARSMRQALIWLMVLQYSLERLTMVSNDYLVKANAGYPSA